MAVNSSRPTWKETAKRAFSQIQEEDFLNKGGVYDKVIIDCAFRKNLMRKKPSPNGGCGGFHPSLTTNGICYTFNGKNTSELWKSSEITNTFTNVFPSQSNIEKFFFGSRTAQGKYL